MLKRTACVEAGIEFTCHLDVREFAPRDLAVRAVPAHGHAGVAEGAFGIGAVGLVLAFLLCLVGKFLGGRGVAGDAFGVFAGRAEGAGVCYVDGGAGWGGGGLVGVGAVLFGAVEVVFADAVWTGGGGLLGGFDFH